MKPIQPIVRNPAYIRLLLQGPRNVGKTSLVLGIAKTIGLPTLIIDFESHDGVNPSSVLYASQYPNLHGVIPLHDITHPNEFLDALATVEQAIHQHQIGTVIVDGLATLWSVTDTLANKAKNKFQEYGNLKPILTAALDRLIALPCHVLATCMTAEKHRQEKDAQGNKVITPLGQLPMFSPKERLPDRFLLACQMSTHQNGTRVLQVVASKLINKSALGMDLSMGAIINSPGGGFANALLTWAKGDATAPKQATLAHIEQVYEEVQDLFSTRHAFDAAIDHLRKQKIDVATLTAEELITLLSPVEGGTLL